MARLSGPRGQEIRAESKAFAEQFHDIILEQITKNPKEERWLWGRQIEDEFTRLIEIMCLELNMKDPL